MILVLNNKSNFSLNEFNSYINNLSKIENKSSIVLCPSSCFIPLCYECGMSIGSQDVSSSDSLAYTGEITARQLKSLNVKYCIVGHADRGEDANTISSKIRMLFNNDILPILCVGEKQKNEDLNEVKQEVLNKINSVMKNFNDSLKDKIIIAYEPIWAVNSDIIIDSNNTREILMFIKNAFPNNKLLYGGGVNVDNYYSLCNVNELDGFLLGRLGNDIDTLCDMID